MSLPAEPASAAVARRFVRDVLGAWGAGDLEDTAVLLTSELVTNAVLHARSAPELRVRLTDGRLRIGVSDSTAAAPLRKRYGPDAATGRGLLLIEAMASAWGSAPNEDGKEVWFELKVTVGGPESQATEAGADATPAQHGDAPDARPTRAAMSRRRPPGGPRASTRPGCSRVRHPARR